MSKMIYNVAKGLQVFASHSDKEHIIDAQDHMISVETFATLSEEDLIALHSFNWHLSWDEVHWEFYL